MKYIQLVFNNRGEYEFFNGESLQNIANDNISSKTFQQMLKLKKCRLKLFNKIFNQKNIVKSISTNVETKKCRFKDFNK